MKRFFLLSLVSIFVLVWAGFAVAADNPLVVAEKKFNQEMANLIPKDHIINAQQFHTVWEEVLAKKRNAYMIDVRTDTEFTTFHIEGTDHIMAGHWYVIPKKIPDANAEIYIWCRTHHRARYVTGFLYKIGYKNVWLYDEGVVGWAKAGYPFVNACTGNFQIREYRAHPSKAEESYRIRFWNSFK